jgi:glycosyltransferase involved in cell wall biosynthesis
MSEKILISICIPTYNRASYLDICLQSILHYKGDNIEVLIQDNDSPDNTSEIVKKYDDPRFVYEKNDTNIGPVKNIWKLFHKARGEYVFCLTDDDYFLPGAIQKLVDFIEATSPICFKTSLIMLLEKSKAANYYKVKDNTKESIFFNAHIFTGLCFQRKILLRKVNEQFSNNYYPSMAIMGLLLDEATFFDEVIAMHIWENEIFWDEGMDPGSSNLKNEIVDLILLLEPHINSELHNKLIFRYSLDNGFIHEKFEKYLTSKDKKNIYKNMIKSKIRNFVVSLGKKLLVKK